MNFYGLIVTETTEANEDDLLGPTGPVETRRLLGRLFNSEKKVLKFAAKLATKFSGVKIVTMSVVRAVDFTTAVDSTTAEEFTDKTTIETKRPRR